MKMFILIKAPKNKYAHLATLATVVEATSAKAAGAKATFVVIEEFYKTTKVEELEFDKEYKFGNVQ